MTMTMTIEANADDVRYALGVLGAVSMNDREGYFRVQRVIQAIYESSGLQEEFPFLRGKSVSPMGYVTYGRNLN